MQHSSYYYRASPQLEHQGVTAQVSGAQPLTWYGALDAVASDRLDPLPSEAPRRSPSSRSTSRSI
ncbi:hypothetical protein I6A84_00845 [Frankia sp. CNm7]|uniref:Uncharacterized protein n=1 Tax=Frankia nepalensis TaxID=1836974 RepID=A0A937RBK9_9ACTN|nr:hypothetical protein [Frankia nepalensis]MBL7496700.1 hypothetical protein [Frankia nepalensis]MBL7511070.1 hypothetical protein [Frankia nepalensis]MBL7516708.1 hypothetical protein [Frankia nepalensis]MBL7627440.1 hypothetical protein [Frankia nepalensis]